MVTVVSKKERDDGKTEVVLSQDGVRVTVVVPTPVAQSDDALNVFQVMANAECKRAKALSAIIAPGRMP